MGVFGELYDQRRDVIHKDKVLVVKGKASRDFFSGGIRLSADELFDIEQARGQLARHMQVRLSAEQVTPELVVQLKSVLAPSEQGLCGVGFEYQTVTGVCQLEVGADWRIVPNKIMLDQLDTLIGSKSIRLIY